MQEKDNKIAIGADHAGYLMKEHIKKELEGRGYEVTDYGTHSENSVDYPDFAHPVAESIDKGEIRLAVVMCGSGNGVNMTVNKYRSVRSALCWNKEIARLARLHNDSNVLALPARFISFEEGSDILEAFLNTTFEGGRHSRRVEKICKK